MAVSPGSANVICGQIVALKTGGGKRVDNLVIKQPLAIKCALGENPKNAYGQSKKTSPMTRMGTAAIFREHFFKAKEYLSKKENSENGKQPDFNMKYEALIPVLKREIPIHIHAHRADDIHTALRLIAEFEIRGVLLHCSEGHFIVSDLSESNIPAIVGPTLSFAKKPETANKSFETVDILLKSGIKACITTDHPITQLEHLNICAALCVKAGLDEREALKAITIYPAEILGLDHRIGSIKPGKDADFAIWRKNPFDATGNVLHTIIDGKIVWCA